MDCRFGGQTCSHCQNMCRVCLVLLCDWRNTFLYLTQRRSKNTDGTLRTDPICAWGCQPVHSGEFVPGLEVRPSEPSQAFLVNSAGSKRNFFDRGQSNHSPAYQSQVCLHWLGVRRCFGVRYNLPLIRPAICCAIMRSNRFPYYRKCIRNGPNNYALHFCANFVQARAGCKNTICRCRSAHTWNVGCYNCFLHTCSWSSLLRSCDELSITTHPPLLVLLSWSSRIGCSSWQLFISAICLRMHLGASKYFEAPKCIRSRCVFYGWDENPWSQLPGKKNACKSDLRLLRYGHFCVFYVWVPRPASFQSPSAGRAILHHSPREGSQSLLSLLAGSQGISHMNVECR